MLSKSLKRSIKLAWSNLSRNKLLSSVTILIMALILFIFNVIFTVNLIAHQTIEQLQNKVDLILYLKENSDTLVINQLVQDLKNLPEVEKVDYISEEEALKGLLEKYPENIDPVSYYNLENPLPSSIQVVTRSPEDHENILNHLEESRYKELLLDINTNNENEKITERLIEITRFSEKLLLGIVITFILGSTLVIANTLHINIFHRRKEIEIMKLVGAPLSFIRGPFMIEGSLYGIGGVIFSSILLLIFSQSIQISEWGLIQFDINYGRLFLMEGLIGILIGVLSSLISVQPLLQKRSKTL